MATLLDLPVLPLDRDSAGYTEIVSETYVAERMSIFTLEDLTAFVTRWKAAWELVCPLKPELKSGPMPVASDEILRLLFIMSAKDFAGPIDPQNLDHVMTMNLILPPAFILPHQLAVTYGVSTDLSFVRAFLDPYPELEEELRGYA